MNDDDTKDEPINETDSLGDIGGTAESFYQGVITYLDRARGRGIVRSNRGREIRFQFPFVAVLGAPIGGSMPGINLLSEGAAVGFDVGWTSRGLRVTVIKPSAI